MVIEVKGYASRLTNTYSNTHTFAKLHSRGILYITYLDYTYLDAMAKTIPTIPKEA